MNYATLERPATEKQLNYLNDLFTQRFGNPDVKRQYDELCAAGHLDPADENFLTTTQASEIISSLRRTPRHELTPEVPDGRYAIYDRDGKLRFYHVRTRLSRGYTRPATFVDEQAGSTRYPIKDSKRRNEVLAAIDADPTSLVRYGIELGMCGVCGRELTDDVSRARGLGPVCAKNHS